jgi:multisubunit Na+/H+ antiporter MnhG subunit
MTVLRQLFTLVAAVAVVMALAWVATSGFGWIGTRIGALLVRLPWFISAPLYIAAALIVAVLGGLIVLSFVAGLLPRGRRRRGGDEARDSVIRETRSKAV